MDCFYKKKNIIIILYNFRFLFFQRFLPQKKTQNYGKMAHLYFL